MTRKASPYQRFSTTIVAMGAALALVSQARTSRADDVPVTGKGIVGGGLLGGEIVILGEAAFGLRSGWGYFIGGVVGIGGGAVAGWQIEKNADTKVSQYMLAGGMALVIPTVVAMLQATSYHAPEDYTEDHPPSGSPVPEPPRPTTTPGVPGSGATLHYRMHWQTAKLALPTGLLDVDEGAFKLAVPAVEIRPTYGIAEVQMYGLEQKHELRLPVFSATF